VSNFSALKLHLTMMISALYYTNAVNLIFYSGLSM